MYYEMLQNMARSGMTKSAGMEKQAFNPYIPGILGISGLGGILGAKLNSEDPVTGAALGTGAAASGAITALDALADADELKNFFKRGKGLRRLLGVLGRVGPIANPINHIVFAGIPTAYGLGRLHASSREEENK